MNDFLRSNDAPHSFAAYLPPVPRPPHDPYTLLLNGQVGWRSQDAMPDALAPRERDGLLTLAPLPDSGRQLSEAGGSFGGLALPPNMAWLGKGRRALLAYVAAERRFLRFDPCACDFYEPYCFAPNDPRRPHGPAAIAVGGERLYIADRTERRVIVLDAATGAARALWTAPLATPDGTLAAWEPSALAASPDGGVWIADRQNGVLLRFSRSGRVTERHDGFGAVFALARDRAGRLLIARDGAADVTDYDPATRVRRSLAGGPERLAERFPKLAVTVHADGSLDLAALCEPPCLAPYVVGADLICREEAPADPPLRFPTRAYWWSQALDSGIADCVWDRIALDARLPPHAGLTVETLTAETELPPDEVASSPAWRTALTLRGDPDGRQQPAPGLDFMLSAPPGRYLWLRVRLDGDGTDGPTLSQLAIDYPRVSWRRYLPAVFGAEPVSAEFTDRWLALFDRTFRDIESEIDRQAHWFDPMSAPAEPGSDFLSWLSDWVGVALGAGWPLARRREFLKYAPRAYAWRGTPQGLTRTLYLLLGLQRWRDYQPGRAACVPCPVEIPERYRWRPPRLLLEHHQLRRWLWLGQGRLSDNAKLWGEKIVNRSQLGAGAASVPANGCPMPPPDAADADGCSSGVYIQASPPAAFEGQARLGVSQLKTWQDPARDPFHVYAHKLSVFVPAACLTAPQRARALEQMLKTETPAHVETRLVAVAPRFRIGVQAMLGLDAVIGYRAQPVRLDDMTLGRATVLGETAKPDDNAAALRVGARRVGMDTGLR